MTTTLELLRVILVKDYKLEPEKLMRHSVALPTMHLEVPDPEYDLDYVANAARSGVAIRTMLSNSFAFGGTNAVLALRAPEPVRPSR